MTDVKEVVRSLFDDRFRRSEREEEYSIDPNLDETKGRPKLVSKKAYFPSPFVVWTA